MARMKALSTIEAEITRTEEELSKIKKNMIPWQKSSSHYRKKSRSMKSGRSWKPIKGATGVFRK